jgi:hypothetical protein
MKVRIKELAQEAKFIRLEETKVKREKSFLYKKYPTMDKDIEITNEDDGFWSGCPFYQGRINGILLSYDKEYIDIIPESEYSNRIIKSPPSPYNKKEEWWEYTNYP